MGTKRAIYLAIALCTISYLGAMAANVLLGMPTMRERALLAIWAILGISAVLGITGLLMLIVIRARLRRYNGTHE